MYDINVINERKERLEKAARNLKKKFIGLDDIIDKVISNLEVWYLMPELLTRPIIINLWGLTGVGKTDLVRTLVRELDFNEKFVEVQLDTGTESGYWNKNTIKGEIDSVGLNENDTGVLLLDEIQRFRSVDEMGKTINNSKYQDIWMLLSDGKLNTKDFRKRNLVNLLFEIYYFKDQEDHPDKESSDTPSDDQAETTITKGKNPDKKEEKPDKKKKFKMSLWSARELKQQIESEEPLDEIMKWGFHKKVQMIQDKIKTLDNDEELDKRYSKLLIFISGNIDSAYSMSDDVSETNVDADILYQYSKGINIIDIKNALRNTFKPEQIARFGNVHIIYPSLSKESYNKLIDLKLNEIIDRTKNSFNIDVGFGESVHGALYRNGVYPAQGVRPLFSTISSLIENSLPTFLMEALFNKSNTISHSISEKESLIYGELILKNGEKKTLNKKIVLELDKIKKDLNKNVFYKTCAHEAGHAVVYALLFNVAPPQIVGDSISAYNNGFIVPHKIINNKLYMEYNIQVLLAGTVAEELVYGEENKGAGATQDMMSATVVASTMIRQCNMGEYTSFITNDAQQSSPVLNTGILATNNIIDKIVGDQKIKVRQLLNDNLDYYRDVLTELIDIKRMSPEQFLVISKKHNKKIKVVENSYKNVYDFEKATNRFINKKLNGDTKN